MLKSCRPSLRCPPVPGLTQVSDATVGARSHLRSSRLRVVHAGMGARATAGVSAPRQRRSLLASHYATFPEEANHARAPAPLVRGDEILLPMGAVRVRGRLGRCSDPELRSCGVPVSCRPRSGWLGFSSRERARFGAALDPDGAMYGQHQAFLRWAAGYDPGLSGGRTLWADATWLGYLPCPVMCLIGECGTAEQIDRVLSFWEAHAHQPEGNRLSAWKIIASIMDSVA